MVTRHGEEVAVVVSVEEYRRLIADLPSFKELLLAAPDSVADLAHTGVGLLNPFDAPG